MNDQIESEYKYIDIFCSKAVEYAHTGSASSSINGVPPIGPRTQLRYQLKIQTS